MPIQNGSMQQCGSISYTLSPSLLPDGTAGRAFSKAEAAAWQEFEHVPPLATRFWCENSSSWWFGSFFLCFGILVSPIYACFVG